MLLEKRRDGCKVPGMKSMITEIKALEDTVEELSQDIRTKYKRKGKVKVKF